MIPDYKLYHGAVLAELVHQLTVPVTIDELQEEGRLSSYTIDGRIGLQIKHSAQRLHPWPFNFTRQNLNELVALMVRFKKVFVVLVCHTDGMVCLNAAEVMQLARVGESDQAWLRVDRRPRQWYSVSGNIGEPQKRPMGLDPLLRAITVPPSATTQDAVLRAD